jgi:hypothetical protein
MKRLSRLLLFIPCLTAGCSSNPRFTTPRVAPALESAPHGLAIEKVSASTHWSSSYGHGLEVVVKAKRPRAAYAPNPDLELADAAKVCAALADNQFVQKWDYLSVLFFNDYDRLPPDYRPVVGAVQVIVEREVLVTLASKGAPAAAYPQRWVLVRGFKDQPGADELLQW